MVLAFALVVLSIMSLMGVALLTSARTELSSARSVRINRDTFNAADASGEVAILMSRALLHPQLGSPAAVLSPSASGVGPRIKLMTKVNEDRFTLIAIEEDSKSFNYFGRYLETGLTGVKAPRPPHMLFTVNEKEVAAASVNLDSSDLVPTGASINGGDRYDTSGGPTLKVTIIVTVNGRSLVEAQNEVNQEQGAVITLMYREFL
ncbi:MAG: pilus assembly PilX N-terminal domain-containing protein [Deltaproteobacteria bacterium]|jgi:hypothetical protein|nr:pilus assembly PilX N-terminal domain-containing protein [Deltaproteobacteria bacterium]